ncbi:hypothetical protein M5K25_013152 [Dendrobium thyrsiflorum]|uniref:Uncharacterized protein n=1 Tax=Dendrobium thyrsiflorum TaxID=117978 RepID=A0ABD0UZJ6_DENTH
MGSVRQLSCQIGSLTGSIPFDANTVFRFDQIVFLTVLITIAAARASRPDVGSSMKMIEGLATSSTAIVNLFLCSVDRPEIPGSPTNASLRRNNAEKINDSRIPPVFLPAKTSIRVVFPAPLTPIRAVRIPGRKAPVTPLSNWSLSSVIPCSFISYQTNF